MEHGLPVRAHELHLASADLGGETTCHLTEELADTGVQLADLADVGGDRRQNRGDPFPQVVGIRHRTVRNELTVEHLAALHELGQHRFDCVEGGP